MTNVDVLIRETDCYTLCETQCECGKTVFLLGTSRPYIWEGECQCGKALAYNRSKQKVFIN
jgi:hypothetical protein